MFPYIFLTAVLLLMPLKCAGFLMCDSDTDCQDGSSCIENICKICVKCSLIFRKGKTCENDFNDCGDCLEGYKEISVTDNSAVKKPCRPMKKRGKLKGCANDNNCPPNHYCSDTSCVECFDCSLLNRLEPERCATDANKCGPCLAGYLLIHDIGRTNYNKCEKVPNDHVSYDISSGSAFMAALVSITALILFAMFHKKIGRGFISSKTIYHSSEPSAPLKEMEEIQHVKYYNGKDCPPTGFQRLEVQQARVYKQPSASYYLTGDEIREADSEDHENSSVPDAPTNAQSEETIFSQRTVLCGECVGMLTRRLSEINSVISGAYTQDEQPVEMNVLNSDSAENNSHLVNEDPSQVPEAPASGSTGDLPLGKGQV